MVKNMTLVFGIIALVELIVIGVLCVGMFIEKRNIHRVIKQAELLAQKNIDLDDVIFRRGDEDMRILVNSVNVIKSNLMSFIEATRGNVITLSEAV